MRSIDYENSSISTTQDDGNIKIFLRIKPILSDSPQSTYPPIPCIQVCSRQDEDNSVMIQSPFNASLQEIFTYDFVGDSCTQEQIFYTVGKDISDNCLLGYNGTIFAYGQTGSGKTHTMFGPPNLFLGSTYSTRDSISEADILNTTSSTLESQYGSFDLKSDHRGLIPRVLEYIFAEMTRESRLNPAKHYLCKCSMVEIYNEVIYDLLDISTPMCNLREDIKKGCVYVEGNMDPTISTPSEALHWLTLGSRHRHIASTAMNRESSRSHSIFTLHIQSSTLDCQSHLTDVRESRFHLVDLAGSERQQWTGATGLRLKEAGNINKSLLALSNVMNALVDIANGKQRHVQYRDSKLTFLLKDSLGGNSKTFIIANINSSPTSYAETLSTLRFAKRAKQVRNNATVNKESFGNVAQLQIEIRRLQSQIEMLSNQSSGKVDSATDDILIMAMESRLILEKEKQDLSIRVSHLEELCSKKEKQLQGEKMIIRLRDKTIKSLTDHQSLPKDVLEQEIQELRKILEHHPDITRLTFEQLQLQEQLETLSDWMNRYQEYQNKLEKLGKYETELAKRIITIQHPNDKSLDNDHMTSLTEENNHYIDTIKSLKESIQSITAIKDSEIQRLNELLVSKRKKSFQDSELKFKTEIAMNLGNLIDALNSNEIISIQQLSKDVDYEQLLEMITKLKLTIIESWSNQRNESSCQLSKMHEIEEKYQNSLKSLESNYDRVKMDLKLLIELNDKLEMEKQDMMTRYENEMTYYENELERLKSMRDQLRDDFERLSDTRLVLEGELEQTKRERDSLQSYKEAVEKSNLEKNELLEQIALLSNQLSDEQIRTKQLESNLKQEHLVSEEQKHSLCKLSELVSETKQINTRLENQLVAIREEQIVWEQERASIRNIISELEQEKEISSSNLNESRNENEIINKKVIELNQVILDYTNKQTLLQEQYKIEAKRYEDMIKEYQDQLDDITRIQDQTLDNELISYQKENASLQEKLQQFSIKIVDLEQGSREKMDQLAQSKQEITRIRGLNSTLQHEQSGLVEKITSLRGELAEMESQWQNQLRLKCGMIDNLEKKIKDQDSTIRDIKIRMTEEEASRKKVESKLRGLMDDNQILEEEIKNKDIIISESCNYQNTKERINVLEREVESLIQERDNLRMENEKLIQHQNMKQKLQYHVKIKKENNDLKQEITLLREELAKMKPRVSSPIRARRISDIDGEIEFGTKENICHTNAFINPMENHTLDNENTRPKQPSIVITAKRNFNKNSETTSE